MCLFEREKQFHSLKETHTPVSSPSRCAIRGHFRSFGGKISLVEHLENLQPLQLIFYAPLIFSSLFHGDDGGREPEGILTLDRLCRLF
jgi:hypothetical protein